MQATTRHFQQETVYEGDAAVKTTSYGTGTLAGGSEQQMMVPAGGEMYSAQFGGPQFGGAQYTAQSTTTGPTSQYAAGQYTATGSASQYGATMANQYTTTAASQYGGQYAANGAYSVQPQQNYTTQTSSPYPVVGQQYGTQYATGAVSSKISQYEGAGSVHYGQQQIMTSSPAYVAGNTTATRSVSEMSRVVGHEYGQQRVVSVTQRVDESKTHIVGERFIEHQVRVPKKIVREEVIEKIIVVPEKVIQEEIIEETATVKEKIIEVAKPIIVEKIVEVPEYEYVEKIIEVPEKIVQERPQYVEKVEYHDRIQEVVKVIPQERIVEVPDIQYRDVPVERVVEVPEWRDEVITKEVPVPQYVDKPVPQVVPVEQAINVDRNIPVPIEANITYEFRIPKIKPRYHKITYPVYLPRFIEVPVALELLQGGLLQQTETYLQQIGSLTKAAASLCEIENLATTIMKADIQSKVSTRDLQSIIMKSWREGSLNVQGLTNTSYSQTTTTTVGPTMISGSHATVSRPLVTSAPSLAAIPPAYTSTPYVMSR